jgi:hypothetical protein
MKLMKKYFNIIFSITLILTLASCKKTINFLDKAPSVDVTEDVVFSSKTQLDIFVNTMYRYGVYSITTTRDNSLSTTRPVSQLVYQQFSETASDEGESNIIFGQSNKYWNNGTVNSSNIVEAEDTRYFQRWISISQCNIIIERVNEVPDATDDYKKQVSGEAKFIRALNYMEMIKRYGGVPIVNKRIAVNDVTSIPRSSFEDCVNFIVKDCDDAIAAGLPLTQPSSLRGRATSLAPMALKAKALLFAASPLFNTGSPYLSLGANNKLICYGNADVNRWKLAADAARAALDVVESSGVYQLIDNPANRDPKYSNPNTALGYTSGLGYPLAAGNYKQAWEIPNNSEVIFACQDNGVGGIGRIYQWPFENNYPGVFGNTAGNYGVGVTQNFVSQYENKTTGLPQTWAGGSDLQTIYDGLDPRFKQTVGFTGNYWNSQWPIIANFASTNGDPSKKGANYDAGGCPSEMWLKKFMPDALFNGGAGVVFTWPLLRVNELYLNYAEALNEFSGPSQPVYDAVNKIRTRSAMPNLPLGLNQAQLRDRIRHERMIELAFEDHRFWDVRRWKIAEQDGIMKGAMYGQKINKLTAGGYSYTVFPYETRIFNTYEYLHGFDLTEVRKGNLIQNPGW